MKPSEAYFCLKMSIIQFLLNKNFNFYNHNNEVIFDLVTNDQKVNLEVAIVINPNNSFYINVYFPVLEKFIKYEDLLIINNCINETSEVFNVYIQKVQGQKEPYSLFFIKTPIRLNEGDILDNDFWESKVKGVINNASVITDFLYCEYPHSKFFQKDLNTLEFKDYLFKSFCNYIEALEIVSEAMKICNSNMKKYSSKEEIEEEIDRELEKLNKGEDNRWKLTLLYNELVNFDENSKREENILINNEDDEE